MTSGSWDDDRDLWWDGWDEIAYESLPEWDDEEEDL